MSTANLPANIANMVQGLTQSVNEVSPAGGDVLFMKMGKDGRFSYGAEEIEVEEGSIWAANPQGFMHGWVAWGDKEHGTAGKNLGEKLGPAHQPIYPQGDLPAVEGSWSQLIGIHFACTNGEDAGVQVLYKANSYGGRKAYGDLLSQVVARIQDGESDIVPLVTLESTSYKHDEYGKIFNPVFVVTGWTSMDATALPEDDEPEEEEEEAPEPPKRKRRAAKSAEEPAEEVPAPASEDEEPPRRRRRRRAA